VGVLDNFWLFGALAACGIPLIFLFKLVTGRLNPRRQDIENQASNFASTKEVISRARASLVASA